MEKLALLIYRYRKSVLTAWTVLVLFFGFFALKLPAVLGGSGFEYAGTYQDVQDILEEDFGIPGSLIVLFENKKSATDGDFKSFIEKTLSRAEEAGASIYQSPLDNPDMVKENRAFALIHFEGAEDEDMPDKIAAIRETLPKEQGFNAALTGKEVIEEDMSLAAQEDLIRAELIGIPIALFVLLLAFGGVVAALVPLITGFVSVVVAMGLLYFTGKYVDLSIFVLNTGPMIGLALGIDFALLFVNRFREELTEKQWKEAAVKTVMTSGRAIVFSGFCVLLGMIGMLFIQVGVFQSVAIGGIAVVLTTVIAANTFLPALLAVIGPRIDKWRILKRKEKATSSWHKFAAFVMRRPVMMAVAATGILIIGALPVFHMKLVIPAADALPKSYETRNAFEKFEDTFRQKDRTEVPIIASGKEEILDSLSELEKTVEKLEKDPLVGKVGSVFSATGMNAAELDSAFQQPEMKERLAPAIEGLTNGKLALLQIELDADRSSEEAKDWVRSQNDKGDNFILRTGGEAKFQQEIFDEIYDKIGYSLTFILLSTFVVLFIAFKSVLIPLKAIIMNVISLGCTFGIVVWLFQEGHLVSHPADIALMIPVFAFSIVFGLSMDYEVFLISRIHEIYLQIGDNDHATLEGLTATSKIITSAAAIMIVITGAFAFTGIVPVQQMGVTVALAIFIDATIVRMLLVPSLMKLLGDLNWWAPFHKQKEHGYGK